MKTKIYVFLVKAIFAVPLILLGLWLLMMLYTPGADAQKLVGVQKSAEEEGRYGWTLKVLVHR